MFTVLFGKLTIRFSAIGIYLLYTDSTVFLNQESGLFQVQRDFFSKPQQF